MKKFVELFSGSNRLTDMLRSRGYEGVSIDWDHKTKADYHIDIGSIDYDGLCKLVGFEPGFIWASPDCTTYSIAQHVHREPDLVSLSPYGRVCDAYNANLWLNILGRCHCPYIVENPRGFYRKMSFVNSPFMLTVCYGDYGTPYPKPTDYFYNDFSFKSYIKEPRSYKGTDRLSNARHGCLGRSFVPEDLLNTLCDYIGSVLDDE